MAYGSDFQTDATTTTDVDVSDLDPRSSSGAHVSGYSSTNSMPRGMYHRIEDPLLTKSLDVAGEAMRQTKNQRKRRSFGENAPRGMMPSVPQTFGLTPGEKVAVKPSVVLTDLPHFTPTLMSQQLSPHIIQTGSSAAPKLILPSANTNGNANGNPQSDSAEKLQRLAALSSHASSAAAAVGLADTTGSLMAAAGAIVANLSAKTSNVPQAKMLGFSLLFFSHLL